jgi:hypothetical protein
MGRNKGTAVMQDPDLVIRLIISITLDASDAVNVLVAMYTIVNWNSVP